LLIVFFIFAGRTFAQHGEALHESSHEAANEHAHGHGGAADKGPHWEGSPEGIRYSEFNHHLAGIFILLIGLTELWGTLGIGLLAWSRFLLPLAMTCTGSYLMIWSDHEAWPVGSMSLSQTLFGGDWEILQHKTYAVLLLSVGAVEGLRWMGRMKHKLWSLPFPLFAIVGGLMLFLHDHGIHPSAHRIALDHAIMGSMAIAGGFCKLVSAREAADADTVRSSRWDVGWAAAVLLIGLQLLFYSE
jgi:putative copper resistance protein D